MYKSLVILIMLLVACGGSQENVSDMSYQEPFISDSIDEMGTSRSMEMSSGDYIIKTAYGTLEVSSSNFKNIINEFETLILTYKGSISNTYLSTNYQGLQIYIVTVNVPAEQFDEFISDIEDISEFNSFIIPLLALIIFRDVFCSGILKFEITLKKPDFSSFKTIIPLDAFRVEIKVNRIFSNRPSTLSF